MPDADAKRTEPGSANANVEHEIGNCSFFCLAIFATCTNFWFCCFVSRAFTPQRLSNFSKIIPFLQANLCHFWSKFIAFFQEDRYHIFQTYFSNFSKHIFKIFQAHVFQFSKHIYPIFTNWFSPDFETHFYQRFKHVSTVFLHLTTQSSNFFCR